MVATNAGKIKSSYAVGRVRGKGSFVGGLLGSHYGTMAASYADVSVVGLSSNSDAVGGLVGAHHGTVTDCYAAGDVKGGNSIGGLVGRNIGVGAIIHSYAVGQVSGQALVGGLVGNNAGTITYSHWDSGEQSDSSGHGIGLASAVLKSAQRPGRNANQAYFGWRETVWDFGSDEQYPALKYTDGTRLPLQREVLVGLELSDGARLLPMFKPSILNYRVLVDAEVMRLQWMPTLSDSSATLNIYKDGKATKQTTATTVVSLALNDSGATEVVMEVRTKYNGALRYRYVVYRFADATIKSNHVGAVDEGARVRLDGTYGVGSINYRYRWQQLSQHTLPSAFATNKAVLEFDVPEDLVARDAADAEIKLRLEVSADDEPLASDVLTITVNKINNAVIRNLGMPTLRSSTLTAPSVDLATERDGKIDSIAYQWQHLPPVAGAAWLNIKNADADVYTVAPTVTDGSRYRVLIDYVDGQGYIHEEIESAVFTVADIDKDDDGLIEIDDLEGINAMRYQSDGIAYRADDEAIKITTGCPESGCNGYELTRDLDFNDNASYRDATNKQTWTTQPGWPPIVDFNSTFNGNGHTIANLYIDKGARNIGLFGTVGGDGTINDVGLLALKIVATERFAYAGGLVGSNSGTVINSYATGDISGGYFIGGLVADNRGIIRNSYAACHVNGSFAAGLVASNSRQIINTYATSRVSGRSGLGGLVSENLGTIVNSYATASISGAIRSGLTSLGAGTVTNSYWDKQTSSADHSLGGLGFSSAQLKSANAQNEYKSLPYYNWNKSDWDFGDAEQYPALKYPCDATMPSRSPKCGALLPNQRVSALLAQLVLSSGVLHPTFAPKRYHYRVQVDDFKNTIGFTPIATNINTKVRVGKNGKTIVAATTAGETVFIHAQESSRTTIVFETLDGVGRGGVRYTLNINVPPKITIADGQRTKSVKEGDNLSLRAAADDVNGMDALRYKWTQLSGPPLLPEPHTQQSLSITIADDLLARNTSRSEAVLKMEVSDGLASASIRVLLNIDKEDNDRIAALEGAPLWLGAYTVLAPDIDLNKDADGVGDESDITYQWQKEDEGIWRDIDAATLKIYDLAKTATPGSRYRAVLSYTDKQGYSMRVNSTATDFVPDIDRDDDGLIEIGDIEGLNAMRYVLDGSGYREDAHTTATTIGCPKTYRGCKGYELVRDLDFRNPADYRDGTVDADWTVDRYTDTEDNGWQPIGTLSDPFSGIFNGNGYTIANLQINRSDGDIVGLFGAVNWAGELNGVGLLNTHIVGNNGVGALVGINNDGRISNSYSYTIGKIIGNSGSGGLIGLNNGQLSNAYAIGKVIGGVGSGGLVGLNRGRIVNSYATGAVDGENQVGGLVGTNSHAIVHSYASVKPTLTGRGTDIGGLVGLNDHSASIVGSYWDITTSEIEDGDDGIGLTTARLQFPIAAGTTATEAYYGWSEDDWDFGNRRQYPAVKHNGAILPAQRVGLYNIELGKGAMLAPRFDANRHDYSVTIHAATAQLRVVPIAKDPDAFVVINDSYEIASGAMSLPILLQATTQTVIRLRVKADNEKPYTLTVDNRFPQIEIEGVPAHAVNEGTTVVLDVYAADADGDELRYGWQQASGPPIVAAQQGNIRNRNDADLSFGIADDLLDASRSDVDMVLRLTVSDGIASIAKAVPLTINKHNSFMPDTLSAAAQAQDLELGEGVMLSPQVSRYTYIAEAPTRRGLTYTAPDINLSLDADGVSPTPRIAYQWQRDIGGKWFNIAAAENKTYTVRGTIAPRYRVLISYMDGQGHQHVVVSAPSLFIFGIFAANTDIADFTTRIYIYLKFLLEGLLPV